MRSGSTQAIVTVGWRHPDVSTPSTASSRSSEPIPSSRSAWPEETGWVFSAIGWPISLAAYLWVFVSYFRSAYGSGDWPLLALSGGVLAYVLQLQTAFTTIATGVAFWAVLGVSVAVMRLQHAGDEPSET